MEKNEVINVIKGIKRTINASDKLIETCIDMANKMTKTPHVRPIVCDELFG